MASQNETTDLSGTVEQLIRTAIKTQHRALLVLAGESAWAINKARQISNALKVSAPYWISNQSIPQATIKPGGFQKILGTECDLLVFDALEGFNPDALGACSGTLRAGGLFLLLIPPLNDWAQKTPKPNSQGSTATPGIFLQHIGATLISAGVTIWPQGQSKDSIGSRLQVPPIGSSVVDPAVAHTDDQQLAIDTVCRVVQGQRKKPALLVSNRGRGKSAAMGLAAARLLQLGINNIVVTANHFSAVKSLFYHANARLPNAIIEGKTLNLGDQTLQFMTPDRISCDLPATELLLVDEAAMIPVTVLTSWLRHYSRIAFATTIHGYEGSGQGFSLRFEQNIQKYCRGIRKVQLRTPIRWAEDDPLEALIFRLLLLNAEPGAIELPVAADPSKIKITLCQRQQLLKNNMLLHQLFGLLVSAHYRTRPKDLRYLLDTPDLLVYLAHDRSQLIGVALVAVEAAESPALSKEIAKGRRRPHGHLLQQALTNHLGLPIAPTMTCRRIVRIAIHPACQRHGFGSVLLRHIQIEAQRDETDLLGSSFAATRDLLKFWGRQGLCGVRIGLHRHAASGQHSALVVQGLSVAGRKLSQSARRRFLDAFEHQLAGPLRTLETDLVITLLQGNKKWNPSLQLKDYDLEMLRAFCDGRQQLAQCLATIHRAVWYFMTNTDLDEMTTPTLQTLIRLGLQYQDFAEVGRTTSQLDCPALLSGLRQELLKHTQTSKIAARNSITRICRQF